MTGEPYLAGRCENSHECRVRITDLSLEDRTQE